MFLLKGILIYNFFSIFFKIQGGNREQQDNQKVLSKLSQKTCFYAKNIIS